MRRDWYCCKEQKEALQSSLSSKVLFYDPYTRKCNTPDLAPETRRREWVVMGRMIDDPAARFDFLSRAQLLLTPVALCNSQCGFLRTKVTPFLGNALSLSL